MVELPCMRMRLESERNGGNHWRPLVSSGLPNGSCSMPAAAAVPLSRRPTIASRWRLPKWGRRYQDEASAILSRSALFTSEELAFVDCLCERIDRSRQLSVFNKQRSSNDGSLNFILRHFGCQLD